MRHSAKHDKHRLRYTATVAVAVFAQLHLFFVLSLHHHDGVVFFSGPQRSLAAVLQKSQPAAPLDSPICPACHISRQGSIQPQSSHSIPALYFRYQQVVVVRQAGFVSLHPVYIPGRSPPLS